MSLVTLCFGLGADVLGVPPQSTSSQSDSPVESLASVAQRLKKLGEPPDSDSVRYDKVVFLNFMGEGDSNAASEMKRYKEKRPDVEVIEIVVHDENELNNPDSPASRALRDFKLTNNSKIRINGHGKPGSHSILNSTGERKYETHEIADFIARNAPGISRLQMSTSACSSALGCSNPNDPSDRVLSFAEHLRDQMNAHGINTGVKGANGVVITLLNGDNLVQHAQHSYRSQQNDELFKEIDLYMERSNEIVKLEEQLEGVKKGSSEYAQLKNEYDDLDKKLRDFEGKLSRSIRSKSDPLAKTNYRPGQKPAKAIMIKEQMGGIIAAEFELSKEQAELAKEHEELLAKQEKLSAHLASNEKNLSKDAKSFLEKMKNTNQEKLASVQSRLIEVHERLNSLQERRLTLEEQERKEFGSPTSPASLVDEENHIQELRDRGLFPPPLEASVPWEQPTISDSSRIQTREPKLIEQKEDGIRAPGSGSEDSNLSQLGASVNNLNGAGSPDTPPPALHQDSPGESVSLERSDVQAGDSRGDRAPAAVVDAVVDNLPSDPLSGKGQVEVLGENKLNGELGEAPPSVERPVSNAEHAEIQRYTREGAVLTQKALDSARRSPSRRAGATEERGSTSLEPEFHEFIK